MPELPDLQVISKNLTKRLKGQKLEKVRIHFSGKVHGSATEFADIFEGESLKIVRREGKQLYFDFGKEAVFSVHLMLNDKFIFPDENAPDKNSNISFLFEKDVALFLADYQKIASVTINPEPANVMDALSDKLTADWLTEKLRSKKAAIKSVLIDQKVIGGIGNAYADEILYAARIDPRSKSNKIPADKIAKLASAIGQVLLDAEEQIQKSYPDLISGEIRDFLAVHQSKNKKSLGGKEILIENVGGKKTYFTDEQIMFDSDFYRCMQGINVLKNYQNQ